MLHTPLSFSRSSSSAIEMLVVKMESFILSRVGKVGHSDEDEEDEKDEEGD